MKLAKSLQTTALLAALATAAHADVLGTARGMWFESASEQDSRQVLFGHIDDALGARRVAMLATLVPDKSGLSVEGLETGRIVGELKEADAAPLSDAVSSVFSIAEKMNKPVSLLGKWKRRTDGIGQFHAIVYVGTGPNSVIGLMHGTFGFGSQAEADGEGILSAQKRANNARQLSQQHRTLKRAQGVRAKIQSQSAAVATGGLSAEYDKGMLSAQKRASNARQSAQQHRTQKRAQGVRGRIASQAAQAQPSFSAARDEGLLQAEKRANNARKQATEGRMQKRLRAIRWRLSQQDHPLSYANPFGVATTEDDDYVTVIDLVDPYSPANPFSTPPKKSLRSGEFVAEWLSR